MTITYLNYQFKVEPRPAIAGLYLKGDISILQKDNSPKIAIVGSRVISQHAKKWLEINLPILSKLGIVIVSGGAFGVDFNSQKIALEHDGKIITVIAGGIDNPTPYSNQDFFKKVVEKGLLVSEYAGKFPATKYAFIKRNRIIAALSDLVVVIEAREKSGALSTADFALDMGIPVAAVPGRPQDELSQGTNNLIKQGAHLITDYNDILELINVPRLNNFSLIKRSLF